VIRGHGANAVQLRKELATTTAHRPIQSLTGRRGAMGAPFIERGPRALGGLEFWRAQRQEGEMEAGWEVEFRRAVPGRAIEHQGDLWAALPTFRARMSSVRSALPPCGSVAI
jgi:hypothetical protein